MLSSSKNFSLANVDYCQQTMVRKCPHLIQNTVIRPLVPTGTALKHTCTVSIKGQFSPYNTCQININFLMSMKKWFWNVRFYLNVKYPIMPITFLHCCSLLSISISRTLQRGMDAAIACTSVQVCDVNAEHHTNNLCEKSLFSISSMGCAGLTFQIWIWMQVMALLDAWLNDQGGEKWRSGGHNGVFF